MVAYTFRVLLAFATILGTGCVLKEPYPNQWPGIHAVKGICPDISGTFADDGWLNPSEAEQTGQAWHKRSLSRLIFTDEGEFDEVTDVQIIQTENHDITLIALNGNTSLVEQSFSIENGDFSCKSGFVEFIGERVCETGNGVMACATPESDLIKNLEGDLIIKTNSRGFGAVYLIPVYVSEWHWYRFEPSPDDSVSNFIEY